MNDDLSKNVVDDFKVGIDIIILCVCARCICTVTFIAARNLLVIVR